MGLDCEDATRTALHGYEKGSIENSLLRYGPELFHDDQISSKAYNVRSTT